MHFIRLAKRALRLSSVAPVVGPFLRWIIDKRSRRGLAISAAVKTEWERRQRIALECQELQRIPRHPGAGTSRNGVLTMHNGLKVLSFSYYGEGMRLLIEAARGVHEPQEEYLFQEVLKCVSPGSTMLELGAYWGFYSMWFHSVVPRARCLLVEPSAENLDLGRANFRLNKMQGTFIQAYVGELPTSGALCQVVTSVDQLLAERKTDRLGILHADIQAEELHMLEGARQSFERGLIDYCFISTHSDALHQQCVAWLSRMGHTILAEYDLGQSYSHDGLVVSKRPGLAHPSPLVVSKRQAPGS